MNGVVNGMDVHSLDLTLPGVHIIFVQCKNMSEVEQVCIDVHFQTRG